MHVILLLHVLLLALGFPQVKVLAADGSQTQVDIAVGSVSLSTISLTATYRYYLASSILTAVEYHAVPVLPLPAARTGAAEGRSLLQQPLSLQAAAAQVRARGVGESSKKPLALAECIGHAALEFCMLRLLHLRTCTNCCRRQQLMLMILSPTITCTAGVRLQQSSRLQLQQSVVHLPQPAAARISCRG